MPTTASELAVGDVICLVQTIGVPGYDPLYRPVEATVVSVVKMRDGSGDYAVTCDGADGGRKSERVTGDAILSLPDDEVTIALQELFKREVEDIVNDQAKQRFARALVHHGIVKALDNITEGEDNVHH